MHYIVYSLEVIDCVHSSFTHGASTVVCVCGIIARSELNNYETTLEAKCVLL